jgi:redox-sensitive bicupin YhaK (pirin superfamily)
VLVHQDAFIYASILQGGEELVHRLAPGRQAYVHVVRGTLTVNGTALAGGDAAKITGEEAVTLSGAQDVEVLLFDLP